mgnify:CR=1 FL=1
MVRSSLVLNPVPSWISNPCTVLVDSFSGMLFFSYSTQSKCCLDFRCLGLRPVVIVTLQTSQDQGSFACARIVSLLFSYHFLRVFSTCSGCSQFQMYDISLSLSSWRWAFLYALISSWCEASYLLSYSYFLSRLTCASSIYTTLYRYTLMPVRT